MEIIIATVAFTVFAAALVLIGTRGRPMVFFGFLKKAGSVTLQNRGPLFWISTSVLLAGGLVYFFYIGPQSAGGPKQPIPFSHRVHAGIKAIDCRFCHPYVMRSTFPGLPPVEKCLYCHNHIITQHPWIRKEHEYFNTQTPVPWVKVNYLAEHVLFNHQRHIRKEIQCKQCHGAVETKDRIEERHFYMGFCIQCHTSRNVNIGCWLACHS